ncbi:MAG: pitrilysin family protein [Deltaproteobacteria bacterium]
MNKTRRTVISPPVTRYEEAHTYRKTTLDNGLRIITEEVPYFQSVSLGIWVRSGSRFEAPGVNGICHFIEHMLFKGTHRRSAYAIAREIDCVGGVLNAFTSKELTSFYCKVTDENLELALDLLTDIFLNASFPEDEIEREKQVICQEIHQLEDCPEDLVHEILGNRFWSNDPLGRPILGTVPSIVNLDRDTVMAFKRDAYSPEETLVCAAGKLEHDHLVEFIERVMGEVPRGSAREAPGEPALESSSVIVNRDLEQVHICLGARGPSAVAESRHSGFVLNTILGGGMSSRLFQEVREKSALAYSVYSFLSSFSNTGLFGIYAGCDPARADELLKIVKQENERLITTITEEDMQTAKNQIKGSVVLAMESSETRMNRLAKGEYYFGRYVSMEEVIEAIDEVTLSDLSSLAEETINSEPLTLVALGPVDEDSDLFSLFHG